MLHIVEKGSGDPLVLIPGLQGRWEYVRPAVDTLSRTFHVVTFSLADEPAAGVSFDARRGLDSYVDQVELALVETRVERATICGISFGGLIALRFAAMRPERTAALVMVSPPGPSWRPRRRHQIYARLPRVFGPIFAAESPWRLRAELVRAFEDAGARRRFLRSQLALLVKAPLSFARMARRALLITSSGVAADAARVASPTLVITGERRLDRVVSVDGSSEYSRLIRGAQSHVLDRTGHLGSITRPDRFAAVVREFVNAHRHAAA